MARIDAELTIETGRATLALAGALDVYTAHRAGALLRSLIAEGCAEIVVDLAAVERIDAAGIGILRGAAAALGDGGTVAYRGARDQLVPLLDDAGIVPAVDAVARPERPTTTTATLPVRTVGPSSTGSAAARGRLTRTLRR